MIQTDSEFLEKFNSYSKSKKSEAKSQVFRASPYTYYPESLDWRTKGAVTGVKNQGDCGASYAFSAVGALEGAVALARGKLTTLSEQNIIDCSGKKKTVILDHLQYFIFDLVSYGNHGCKGGNMHNAYMYILANDGIESSNSYPFQGRVSLILMIPFTLVVKMYMTGTVAIVMYIQ